MQTASRGFVAIVSGLPRSGTSMMMKMLEAGGMPVLIDHLRTADEDNPNGYYEFEAVKQTREDASWLQSAPGKAVKMVYRLLYDLPSDYEYRVIFMRREMQEVLASQRKMLERSGQADSSAVSDEQIAQLFLSQLRQFESWIKQQPNFRMIEISYNQLLKDPGPEAEKIASFLDLPLSTSSMAEVVNPDLYRNRALAPT